MSLPRLLIHVTQAALAIGLIAIAAAAAGRDVTGEWKGALGEGREVTLKLKADGGKVSGTMTDAEGTPRQITRGTIEGDKMDLTVASEWQGQPVTLRLEGTVEENEMRLAVRSEDGSWESTLTAKRSK